MTRWTAIFIPVCFLLAGACDSMTAETNAKDPGASVQEAAGGAVQKIKPVEDKEVLALMKTAVTSQDTKESAKALAALHEMALDRVLGAMAYALSKGEYRQEALNLLMASEFRDERLAPSLAQCIMEAQDDVLLLAVKVAKGMTSQELLPALIEHALKSEFYKAESMGGGEVSVRFEFDSVFANTAEALYKITNGKIGIEKYSRRKKPDAKEMQPMTAKWNEWWEANKPKVKDNEKKDAEKPRGQP